MTICFFLPSFPGPRCAALRVLRRALGTVVFRFQGPGAGSALTFASLRFGPFLLSCHGLLVAPHLQASLGDLSQRRVAHGFGAALAPRRKLVLGRLCVARGVVVNHVTVLTCAATWGKAAEGRNVVGFGFHFVALSFWLLTAHAPLVEGSGSGGQARIALAASFNRMLVMSYAPLTT